MAAHNGGEIERTGDGLSSSVTRWRSTFGYTSNSASCVGASTRVAAPCAASCSRTCASFASMTASLWSGSWWKRYSAFGRARAAKSATWLTDEWPQRIFRGYSSSSVGAVGDEDVGPAREIGEALDVLLGVELGVGGEELVVGHVGDRPPAVLQAVAETVAGMAEQHRPDLDAADLELPLAEVAIGDAGGELAHGDGKEDAVHLRRDQIAHADVAVRGAADLELVPLRVEGPKNGSALMWSQCGCVSRILPSMRVRLAAMSASDSALIPVPASKMNRRPSAKERLTHEVLPP